ncbi:DUF134 domain-containing protein [Clostridium sp. Cult2]|uniref:DUF134 domain-containing protein n=1 Tax=Clostridium sp. Cult2 TaxID=2079003 RepID=UPI001F1DA0A6|nr:DUF134 domain-containing protein [Clostridium sp. Cult2]MCF6464357.1 hypothetical protein [Clostridium sp. Cult2]
MARPIKCRKIEFFPDTTYFMPSGKENQEIEEVRLKLEELEAIRLKDMEGLTQQECADIMEVSRQTFQNIIDSARKKIAIALTQGLAINIKGGNFAFSFCELKCNKCNKTYEINYIKDKNLCPSCNSEEVVCKKKNRRCSRWCSR